MDPAFSIAALPQPAGSVAQPCAKWRSVLGEHEIRVLWAPGEIPTGCGNWPKPFGITTRGAIGAGICARRASCYLSRVHSDKSILELSV